MSTDVDTQNNTSLDLIKDEYREKWAYIRHREELEQKYIHWHYTIIAALLAFIFREHTNIEILLKKPETLILTFFASIFSTSLYLFILLNKRNYTKYNDRISTLEKQFNNVPIPKRNKPRIFYIKIIPHILLTSILLTLFLVSLCYSKIPYSTLIAIIVFAVWTILLFFLAYKITNQCNKTEKANIADS